MGTGLLEVLASAEIRAMAVAAALPALRATHHLLHHAHHHGHHSHHRACTLTAIAERGAVDALVARVDIDIDSAW